MATTVVRHRQHRHTTERRCQHAPADTHLQGDYYTQMASARDSGSTAKQWRYEDESSNVNRERGGRRVGGGGVPPPSARREPRAGALCTQAPRATRSTRRHGGCGRHTRRTRHAQRTRHTRHTRCARVAGRHACTRPAAAAATTHAAATRDSETVHAAPVPAGGRAVPAHGGEHAERVPREPLGHAVAAVARAARRARQRLHQHAVAGRAQRLRRRRPGRRRVGPAC